LADKGLAAPLIAFAFSFTILFREGLEAVLLVAVLLGSLKAGRATNYRRPLVGGIAAAILATIATWLLAAFVIEIAPFQRELIEGITAFAAVVVLFVITFWLVARLEHRHWMEFMRARVSSAIASGTALAFAGLGFTAVYREGFETALFYQALALFAEGLELWIVLGALTAAVALGVVGYAILKLGKRLPLKPMLMTGAMLLLALSLAFVGNAVRSLQEGDWIGVTPVDGDWARLPIYVAELTGIHPTKEGLLTQATLLCVYVVGGLLMFVVRPALRRGSEVARA
jgi:high-affinity iron transporter